VARNAFALALLTTLALGGCSLIKGDKEAKEAEAKLVALRARTDSLRKARRVADSLAQVRFTVCADSVRTEMNRPPVATKTKKRKRKKEPAFVPPSEELIVTQAQVVCGGSQSVPPTTIATTDSASAKATPADSSRVTVPAQATAEAAPAAVATEAPASPPATESTGPQAQDTVTPDSVRKAREMDMSRETFAYSGAARDPFNSLLNMAKTGPELADLQLVGIYQNLRAPSASVAVFREKDGGKRHKLRAGDQVGRSRLVQIRDRDVVFMIEDFGFERQETLSLRKQEDVTP
jgi:hypothetical protein